MCSKYRIARTKTFTITHSCVFGLFERGDIYNTFKQDLYPDVKVSAYDSIIVEEPLAFWIEI